MNWSQHKILNFHFYNHKFQGNQQKNQSTSTHDGQPTKNNHQKSTKKYLRIQSQSSLNNIDGVIVLGLEPSIITISDCFIDLHAL